MNARDTGALGERAAGNFLRGKGYRLVGANYNCRFGEIDLIAEKDGFLAFVEVKTRTEGTPYAPREAVGPVKQQRIIRAAMLYLSQHRQPLQPRFDVIEVILKKTDPHTTVHIEHIENAFTL